MDEATPRLGLPLIAPGQAQKEMTHNEALAMLDLAVQPVVEAVGTTAPPTDAVIGQAWALGETPIGDWVGQAGTIAGWTAGGWRFAAVQDGAAVWSRADAAPARRDAGGWTVGKIRGRMLVVDGEQVVGAREPAIVDPAGGATVDAEARKAVAAILAALRTHGLVAS